MKAQTIKTRKNNKIMNILVTLLRLVMLPLVGIYTYTHPKATKQQQQLGFTLAAGGVIIWLLIILIILLL